MEESEWRTLFDASGILRNMHALRTRAYYGGFAPAVRREGVRYC